MQSIKERREKYVKMEKKGFSTEEILRVMPNEELEMNARRGGKLAKKELKRREALANLHPMPIERDMNLGV